MSREEYKRRAQLFVEAQGPPVGASAQGRTSFPRAARTRSAPGATSAASRSSRTELGADKPLTIVYAAGSGGTGAGLVLGIKMSKLPWRAVGINVCDDREYFVDAIGEIVEQAIARWKLDVTFDRSELEICDGHVGLGYAKSRPEELATLRDVARAEGLILDPVYTGKAFHGLRQELARDPGFFGERICFLHTGGIFGLFPKAAELAAVL